MKLEGEPTLIISSKLQNQIDYLHSEVGKKEWSGPLIYKILSGDINDPENLVIEAAGLFLMNIGSAGGTSYEMSAEDTIDMVDEYPEMETGDVRTGLIHTHHNMKVYFSGVDDDELKDNTQDHNAYLSLIVGFNLDYVARVAFISEIERKKQTNLIFQSIANKKQINKDVETETKKVISYYDCDIKLNINNIGDSFISRYSDIVERKKAAEKKKKQGYKKGQRKIGYYNGYGYNKNNYNSSNNSKKSSNAVNPGNYAYSDKEVEEFLCKICTLNPGCAFKNIETIVKGLGGRNNIDSSYLNASNVLSVIDRCIKSVFKGEAMTNNDIIDLLIESIDYLDESYGKEKSLAEKYELAGKVKESLEEILDELEIVEQPKEKNNGIGIQTTF